MNTWISTCLTSEWARERIDRVNKHSKQLSGLCTKWAVRVNECSERPSGLLKTRLSLTRNASFTFLGQGYKDHPRDTERAKGEGGGRQGILFRFWWLSNLVLPGYNLGLASDNLLHTLFIWPFPRPRLFLVLLVCLLWLPPRGLMVTDTFLVARVID